MCLWDHVFFTHECFLQNVLDFVNWFKGLRSDDISVGITKIRQITFQKRSAPVGDPKQQAAGGGGGDGSAQEDAAYIDGQSSCAPPIFGGGCSADCFASMFLQQLLELPTKTRAAVDKLLQPQGISLPSVNNTRKHFAKKYTNAAQRKRVREENDLGEMQYRMTYKTSMCVELVVCVL